MTNTRRTTVGAAGDTTTERSRKMITHQTAHRDFEAVENLLTSLTDGGREPSIRLAAQNTRAALARTQEDAAIEAQDVLSQADEALVLG